MTTYFTSDWHLGHNNIIRLSDRPFKSIVEMDQEYLVQAHALTANDTLVFLGDILWRDTNMYRSFFQSMECEKILITGNHDACWSPKKRSDYHKRRWLSHNVFDEIEEYTEWVTDSEGIDLLLSHFPYMSDSRHTNKYDDFLPEDNGRWLLHGHVHKAWRHKSPRQINVGVDVWNHKIVPEPIIEAYILGLDSDPNSYDET